MHKHPEALLYGQDVGGRIGGVFREAVTLQQKFEKKSFQHRHSKRHTSLALPWNERSRS